MTTYALNLLGNPSKLNASKQLVILAEALCFGQSRAPGWTSLPAPLLFYTLLRQYLPDYMLGNPHEEGKGSKEAE